MVEHPIPLETGAENAGAMKQIRNAEIVDSGTQDSYQATQDSYQATQPSPQKVRLTASYNHHHRTI